MKFDVRHAAAAAAAIIGLALFVVGVWQTLVIGLLALVGWIIASYLTGRFPDVDERLGQFFDRRRNRD